MTKTLLSFGHGLSARTLTPHLVKQGWRVIGTTRSVEKTDAIRRSGAEPLIWPPGECTTALRDASHILISVSPSAEGDPVLNELATQIRNASHLEWVGYLSTTGVYGDHQGGWVDETTPLNPSTKRGLWRKQAEEAWLAIPDLPVHIFRLAGIYGPGRGPFSKLRNGTARRIIKKDQVFSRIHVDDIAQVLLASIARPNPGAIYNLCDDKPAPPQDIIAYAAHLLGMPVPPEVAFEDADMTPMARSFYAESKRVHNNRIKEELGVTLKYATYEAVLQAMLKDETD